MWFGQGQLVVLPQASACAEMKGIRRLGYPETWAGLGGPHLSFGMVLIITSWQTPHSFCIGCHLFIHCSVFIFGSQVSTGVLNRNFTASCVASRALLLTLQTVRPNAKPPVGMDHPGAPCPDWCLTTTHPGSRRASLLVDSKQGSLKFVPVPLLYPLPTA